MVGAPCGIMDQMTSALGQPDALLALLCQPAEVQGFVPLPPSIGFWGIDSGIRHAVSGSDYTSVRTGAFMGYRMIAEAAGLQTTARSADGVCAIDDSRWGGYLANLTPEEFDRDFASRPSPDDARRRVSRGDMAARPTGSLGWTRAGPTRSASRRLIRFTSTHGCGGSPSCSRANPDEPALQEMGELMYGSHASYSACGLGSDGTDLLVELVRQAGPAAGLFGAKITGGGSGGTVAILGRADAGSAVAEIGRRYHEADRPRALRLRRLVAGRLPFGVRRMIL